MTRVFGISDEEIKGKNQLIPLPINNENLKRQFKKKQIGGVSGREGGQRTTLAERPLLAHAGPCYDYKQNSFFFLSDSGGCSRKVCVFFFFCLRLCWLGKLKKKKIPFFPAAGR